MRHDERVCAQLGVLEAKSFAARLIDEQRAEEEARIAAEHAALQDDLIYLRRELAEVKFELTLRRIERKYDPNQPRVPKGNPDGGKWTTDGASDAGKDGGGSVDPIVLSDAVPVGGTDAPLASNRPRGPVVVRIGTRTFELEGGQAARFVEAQSSADAATARVRELDRNWKPTTSLTETVEGQISAYRAAAREADARLGELARAGIGQGPYVGESIPARGPERRYNEAEREKVLRMFNEGGCHTCGTRDAGTPSGNPVMDHQIPSALNPSGRAQRLYPQCAHCSAVQGGWVRSLTRPRQ